MDRGDREESCFSRAARSLRRALSRICRGQSPPSSDGGRAERPSDDEIKFDGYLLVEVGGRQVHEETDSGSWSCESYSDRDSDCDFSNTFPPEDSLGIEYGSCHFPGGDGLLVSGKPVSVSLREPVPDITLELIQTRRSFCYGLPPRQKASQKRHHTGQSPRETKQRRYSFGSAAATDPPDSMSDQLHSSAAAPEPGTSQDETRGVELHAAASPSSLQLSSSDEDDPDYGGGPSDEQPGCLWTGPADPKTQRADPSFYLQSGTHPDDGGPSSTLSASRVSTATCSPPTGVQDSATSSGGGGAEDALELEGDGDAVVEVEAPVRAENYPAQGVHHTCPGPGPSRRSSFLPPLPGSCEEFTPAISADGDGESYRLQSSCPGLYQCSLTGLVFHMQGGGEVLYRTVPWNRRLLAQLHKKPAGPLFDIQCVQRSVCQLHLPHCETRPPGEIHFLSVAHVTDEGIEFIGPQVVTETHVVIDITGLSAFGNVKDEDSPPHPVRALVLLFYRPPEDPGPKSVLNVLLLPRNVVLRDVLRTRQKVVGDESYIETSPHCKLLPGQEYSLSTCPEDDSVLVQPKKAEFDEESYDDYYPSFQVRLKRILAEMKLLLRDSCSSIIEWDSEVSLPSGGAGGSCGRAALNLPSKETLFQVRRSFIDGISKATLKSLLDSLLEKKVLADSEWEAADAMPDRRDRARFVLDTVRKKGEAASSEMVEFLCEADPFLCERLGLV